ncbi:L-histidine N(alpha)-methyltransferase [Algivirga pacifica]|uniref:L-histidine N(Alpha)-methyltransferase n=1 Tax=Algivirga pacifica TaxID=1162670 RepID=A0ABP9DA16_9BACT
MNTVTKNHSSSTTKNTPTYDTAMAEEVLKGLQATQKYLPSKYFYDGIGDELFQKIMAMEEYYLTDCEMQVFREQATEIFKMLFGDDQHAFDVVEFGAGDGTKTRVLLKYFLEKQLDFSYLPIDISENVLEQLSLSLKKELPALDVQPMAMDYFKALEQLQSKSKKKVVFFLGSNIGNLTREDTVKFLQQLSQKLNKGDMLLMGMDLKKSPATILQAYDDQKGITRDFNMNLLERLNKELGADFQVENFQHFPSYNPLTGETKSFLVSKIKQSVHFSLLGKTVHFEAWEAIYTELSKKYDLKEIQQIAQETGFEVKQHFFDDRQYYVDTLWVV